MEEYTLKLQKLVPVYLEHNGLSVAYMARKIGISFPALFKFLNGQIKLSEKNIKKIWNFLEGNFLVPVDYIVADLAAKRNCNEDEIDDQDKLKAYLEINDLSVTYCAKIVKVSVSSLLRWINHERDLSNKHVYRIKEFMTGNFLHDARLISLHIVLHEGIEEDGTE